MSWPRSMRAFYAFTFFWALNPTQGLWILYLLHCHWSLLQVGFAEAGFHVVSFLAQVPTGLYADHWGRQKSLAAGLIVQAVTTSATLIAAPNSVILGGLAISLGALAWAFIGGANQALLFDLLPEESAVTLFGRVYGAVFALDLAVGALSTAVGGWLAAHYGWAFPYGITVVSALSGLVPVYLLPVARSSSRSRVTWKLGVGSMRSALISARAIPQLSLWIGLGAGLATFATINNLYAQSTLVFKGASIETASFLVALSGIVTALGGWLSGRLNAFNPARLLSLGAMGLGIAISMVGWFPLKGSSLGYLSAAGLDGVLDPVYETAITGVAPQDWRATILSLPSAGFSLGMIILFPLAGWGMEDYHLKLVYGFLGLGLILVGVGFRRALRPFTRSFGKAS